MVKKIDIQQFKDKAKMIKLPFLSIIIPVYNVENYLSQCLDSILSCKFSSYEIILIIGNSTDRSNQICMDYANNYSQITIVTQNGTGLSNARNCGMSIAAGTYVMYIDSDDFIQTAAFDTTIQAFYDLKEKHYDILISDFILINSKNEAYAQRSQIKDTDKIIEDNKYIKTFLLARGNFWNVWRYIYRRDFLINNDISFKENYKSEDIDYSTKILLRAKNCCFYHTPYYCYRVRREGSLVNVITMQNVDNLLEVLQESISNIDNCKTFHYKSIIINKLLTEYIFSFLLLKDIAPSDKQLVLQKISNYKELLKHTFTGRLEFFFISILGIENIAYILHQLRRLRRKLYKIL